MNKFFIYYEKSFTFIVYALAAFFADRGVGVAEGVGRLGDLLFLDPVEMGEGVTRDGGIPHLFRVHWVMLGALVASGLAGQLLPGRG